MYEEEVMTQFIWFVQVEKFNEGAKIAVIEKRSGKPPSGSLHEQIIFHLEQHSHIPA
jgi:hypothetical protein